MLPCLVKPLQSVGKVCCGPGDANGSEIQHKCLPRGVRGVLPMKRMHHSDGFVGAPRVISPSHRCRFRCSMLDVRYTCFNILHQGWSLCDINSRNGPISFLNGGPPLCIVFLCCLPRRKAVFRHYCACVHAASLRRASSYTRHHHRACSKRKQAVALLVPVAPVATSKSKVRLRFCFSA